MENENKGEIIIYQSEDGIVQLDVRLENETVWLTIDQMSLLFGKARSTINEHILNAFQDGELNESDSVRKIGNSDFSTKPKKNTASIRSRLFLLLSRLILTPSNNWRKKPRINQKMMTISAIERH